MKNVKKIVIFFLMMGCLIIVCKFLSDFLWNEGYIPLTEEYECRVYMNHYKECEQEFDLLLEELNMLIDDISMDVEGGYDKVFIFNEYPEWIIRVEQEEECLIKWKEQICNEESIKKIESSFDESLIAIIYRDEDKEYKFCIGEYYRIIVSEDGVTVE